MRSIYAALVARLVHGWGRAFCFVFLYASLNPAFAGKTTDVAFPRVVKSGWDVVYNATVGGTPSTGSIGPRTYTLANDVWGDVLQTEKGWLTRSGAFDRTAPSIEATITRRVPWSSVARIASKTIGVVGVASIAYDVWTELRCKFEDGQIKCDPGIDPTGVPPTDPLWVPNGDTAYARSTPSAACSAYSGAQSPGCTSMSYNPSTYACTATCTSGYQAQYAVQAKCPSGYKLFNSGTTWTCEPLDGSGAPGGQCPDGQTPSVFDGKCPSGNYHPKSEDDAADHFGKNAGKVPGIADKVPGIVAEGDKAGQGAPAGDPQITGPASQQGKPETETVTGPNGTTTTTKVPTYNYTYGPNSVTYSTTTVTTQNVTNNAGDTITNTTTQTDAPEQDNRSECEKSPDTVGCTPLGEVPDEEVTKITKDVAVSAEAVNLPAQCPSPIDAAGYSLSFDAACDFSEGVHPFVLAAAALMAGLIVIRSIQGA